jgi:hypothetical protein
VRDLAAMAGEYIIGQFSKNDPRALKLWTTENQHFIENERPEQERSPESMLAAYEFACKVSPEIKCRSLSSMYNCAGMIFAFRRTRIEDNQFEMILRDDGYRVVPREKVYVGDVVVYKKSGIPQHVGLVHSKEAKLDPPELKIWVHSQWGIDGEYIHPLLDVPPGYGQEVEFWSDRKGLDVISGN